VGFSVLIFALYYLLKDGNKFVNYVEGVVPLPNDVVKKLLSKTYCTTWAVIKNHVLIAILQGLVAGVGLWITGIPNVVFWTFVMSLMAFVPVVGTFLIWGPAAVYLAMTSKPMEGLALALYGLVVVALTDNVMRAALVNGGVELHPAVILIGVVGGVYVFGAPGLLIGPVVFGVLKAVLEVF
jgi:predicted PurR-regulated permease PerM